MREIKFRGKRIDNGAWETGSLVVIRSHCSDKQVFIAGKMTGYHTPVEPTTIGQYTGLKDKNGTEIYEGDIIFRQDEVGHVKFSEDGSFLIRFPHHLARMNATWGPIEVIGNIHDNPELLGGAE